jgi:ligand-binding sensor domain-containing protein
MLQDSKGNIWFGTNSDGVARFDGTHLTYFSRKDGFCGDAVRDMREDARGNVWFATSGGVCHYDGKSFKSLTQNDGLGSNQVRCILIDKNGIVWFGTDGGVNTYDGKSITSFTVSSLSTNELADKAYPPLQFVNWMLQDKEGNIWFCTGKGVMRYDGHSIKVFSKTEGLCNDVVETAYEDKSGHLWFGCRFGGLTRYSPKANTFTNFSVNDGLCNNFVWTFLQDNGGTLWIATAGGGLCSIDKASMSSTKPTFTAYGETHGLLNRFVQSLLEDNKGRLWVGTSGGAFRYTREHYFVNITQTGPWE